ncbi:MAG: CaiB/BaiF CoA-transferase family protein [Acidimicrobiales bacterium]|nr:CaiB/BaiF CoA-transferase family protein [Acidimicrobiales bacterium]MDG1875799.1 CaiB/BaiF CoA-transferase family protein [Acidimicrobiales bacterium]
MSAPLDGVIVLAVEQAIAAPFCTRQLVDLGARVLKIERPGTGDFARDYDTTVDGSSAFFVWGNRGKDSLELDLKDPDDRATFDRLLAGADVFIQNLAPAGAERAGLLAHQVRERHPSIIACGISGYGLGGPRTDDKAYDLAIQAEAGAISLTGSEEAPSKVGFSAADIASAMYALSSVLAALYRRAQTGDGATIEISMLECLAEWTAAPTYGAVGRGVRPSRVGHRHAMISPYGIYSLADSSEILLAVQNQTEWEALARNALGMPDLVADERFATNEARVSHIDEFEPLLRAGLASAGAEEMLGRLRSARIAFSRVNDPIALWEHEQLRARDRFVETDVPTGRAETYRAPFNIDGTPDATPVVPGIGQHDPALLDELRRRAD